MSEPWKMKPLNEWSIVGMNHYHAGDERRLFVAMTKDGRCIQSEGTDDEYLWNQLCHKAWESDARATRPRPLGLSDKDVQDILR